MEIISNLDLILYLNLLLMANQFMVGGYKEDMCSNRGQFSFDIIEKQN